MHVRQGRVYLPAFMNTILSEGFDASATIHARLRCLMCKPVFVWSNDAYPYAAQEEKTSLIKPLS